MGLSIKHAATEAKVRELARRRRQSMTRVIHDLVDQALKSEPSTEERRRDDWLRKALAFVEEQDRDNAGQTFPTQKEMDAWVFDGEGHPSR